MRGEKKIIAILNDAIKAEFTSAQQYLLNGSMLQNWGVHKLAAFELGEMAEERAHAGRLVDRVLFLDGVPVVGEIGKVKLCKNLREMLETDLALEIEAVKTYREAIHICEDLRDYGTAELFEELLEDEEGHVDHIESMLWQIDNMGIENFIQLHSNPAKE
jgi:bacterioferritin